MNQLHIDFARSTYDRRKVLNLDIAPYSEIINPSRSGEIRWEVEHGFVFDLGIIGSSTVSH
jgi:hypothetical protein